MLILWYTLSLFVKYVLSKVLRTLRLKVTPKAQRTAPKSTHTIAEGPVISPILEDSEDVFMIPSLSSRVAPIPVTVIVNGAW